jgi:hypothetical protein
MAKAATTPRKKKTRATRRTTGMAAIPTKSWEGAKYYTHYEVESREWGATVKAYIKQNLDKKQQGAINKLPDWKIGSYSHWAATAKLLEVTPDLVPESYKQGFTKWLEKLVDEGNKIVAVKKAEEKTKKKAYVPSIQERLMEAAEEKTGELDEWIDDFLRDPKKGTLKDKMPLNSFRKNEINLGHTRWIQKWFQGPLEELEELINLPKKNLTEMEKQLQEGYDHLTKPQQKELYEFHKRIFQAMEILRAEKKQTRAVRKPKQKSAQELVKKMKFKSSDPDLGIASVNPAEVIDATAIVVFNCKNRKLGIYYAEDHATIKVKGTTLQFFDEAKSLQKTVRKPQEILPHWKKITKHKLEPQFSYLKTTETKLNGRMNEDTVILKVFK